MSPANAACRSEAQFPTVGCRVAPHESEVWAPDVPFRRSRPLRDTPAHSDRITSCFDGSGSSVRSLWVGAWHRQVAPESHVTENAVDVLALSRLKHGFESSVAASPRASESRRRTKSGWPRYGSGARDWRIHSGPATGCR